MIYCKVRVLPKSLPPVVEEGKLMAFALIESEQYIKSMDADKVAQACADHHGVSFEVVQVTELLQRVYKPTLTIGE